MPLTLDSTQVKDSTQELNEVKIEPLYASWNSTLIKGQRLGGHETSKTANEIQIFGFFRVDFQ